MRVEPEPLRLPGELPRPAEPPAARGALHWLLLIALVSAPAIVFATARGLEPDPRGHGTHEQLGLAPCGFLARTGRPCPGCGVTTSLALLARGRLRAAALHQPLGPASFAALLAAAAWALRRHLGGADLRRALEDSPWRRLFLWSAVLVLAAWAYRWLSA